MHIAVLMLLANQISSEMLVVCNNLVKNSLPPVLSKYNVIAKVVQNDRHDYPNIS